MRIHLSYSLPGLAGGDMPLLPPALAGKGAKLCRGLRPYPLAHLLQGHYLWRIRVSLSWNSKCSNFESASKENEDTACRSTSVETAARSMWHSNELGSMSALAEPYLEYDPLFDLGRRPSKYLNIIFLKVAEPDVEANACDWSDLTASVAMSGSCRVRILPRVI